MKNKILKWFGTKDGNRDDSERPRNSTGGPEASRTHSSSSWHSATRSRSSNTNQSTARSRPSVQQGRSGSNTNQRERDRGRDRRAREQLDYDSETDSESEQILQRNQEEAENMMLAIALRSSVQDIPGRSAAYFSDFSFPSTELNPAEKQSSRYWSKGRLGFDDKVRDGFYDLYGDFPEVVDRDEFPSYKQLQGVTTVEGDLREVVYVHSNDPGLSRWEEQAIEAIAGVANKGALERIQAVATLVAEVMGGPVQEHQQLYDKWKRSTQKIKAANGNKAIIPIGKLRVGLSCHRALLFKVFCERLLEIECELLKGKVFGGTEDTAMNLVRADGQEWAVDLVFKPGRLYNRRGSNNLSQQWQQVQSLPTTIEPLSSDSTSKQSEDTTTGAANAANHGATSATVSTATSPSPPSLLTGASISEWRASLAASHQGPKPSPTTSPAKPTTAPAPTSVSTSSNTYASLFANSRVTPAPETTIVATPTTATATRKDSALEIPSPPTSPTHSPWSTLDAQKFKHADLMATLGPNGFSAPGPSLQDSQHAEVPGPTFQPSQPHGASHSTAPSYSLPYTNHGVPSDAVGPHQILPDYSPQIPDPGPSLAGYTHPLSLHSNSASSIPYNHQPNVNPSLLSTSQSGPVHHHPVPHTQHIPPPHPGSNPGVVHSHGVAAPPSTTHYNQQAGPSNTHAMASTPSSAHHGPQPGVGNTHGAAPQPGSTHHVPQPGVAVSHAVAAVTTAPGTAQHAAQHVAQPGVVNPHGATAPPTNTHHVPQGLSSAVLAASQRTSTVGASLKYHQLAETSSATDYTQPILLPQSSTSSAGSLLPTNPGQTQAQQVPSMPVSSASQYPTVDFYNLPPAGSIVLKNVEAEPAPSLPYAAPMGSGQLATPFSHLSAQAALELASAVPPNVMPNASVSSSLQSVFGNPASLPLNTGSVSAVDVDQGRSVPSHSSGQTHAEEPHSTYPTTIPWSTHNLDNSVLGTSNSAPPHQRPVPTCVPSNSLDFPPTSAPASSQAPPANPQLTSSTNTQKLPSPFGAVPTLDTPPMQPSPFAAPVSSAASAFAAPVSSAASAFAAPVSSAASVFAAPVSSAASAFAAPVSSAASAFAAPVSNSASAFAAPVSSAVSAFAASALPSPFVPGYSFLEGLSSVSAVPASSRPDTQHPSSTLMPTTEPIPTAPHTEHSGVLPTHSKSAHSAPSHSSDSTHNMSQHDSSGMSHGVSHGMSHGVSHGVSHGMSHGMTHGMAHGASHGTTHGMPPGVSPLQIHPTSSPVPSLSQISSADHNETIAPTLPSSSGWTMVSNPAVVSVPNTPSISDYNSQIPTPSSVFTPSLDVSSTAAALSSAQLRAHEREERAENKKQEFTAEELMRRDALLGVGSFLELDPAEIQLGSRIGIGSYGEVYKGTWGGTEVAVKRFLEQGITPEVMREFRAEVSIMNRLRHPNIVLFMGAVTKPNELAIVTQYVPRGSLFRILHRTKPEIDNRKRLNMALDIARGLHYLHSSKPAIVHRDLKSPNLLVDRDWTIKVCDFGLSKTKAATFLTSKSHGGTPEWMAPEILRSENADERSDVYSYGVVLYELVTGLEPWQGKHSMAVVGMVGFANMRLPLPEDMEPSIADLIKRCWAHDPRQRPSFGEILEILGKRDKAEGIPPCATVHGAPPPPLPSGGNC